MEIVTLIEISLNRIGTAQGAGGAFSASKSRVVFSEAEDAEIETVRDIVIKAAEENGETGVLDDLKHEHSYGAGTVVFNIQGANVFYSQVYAECEVFPALKSGGRYFRLQEIKPHHAISDSAASKG
ncbi:hypothetical protein [Pseudomonas saliphila]|uniref:hypothetical protein n=1 Tax=Pseudomonas saliphila TaxID=2586906 RepID=UPI00123AC6D4|nr:hypothetical protein [Pseudomonas saliphila]